MQNNYQTFHVGINIFVVKKNQLLLGKRKNIYGGGTWGLPGGHLESGEAMKTAAARELMEETGLQSANYTFSNIVNDKSSGTHYLQIAFIASEIQDEPIIKEPDRCEEWRWFKFNKLPKEIFPPHVKQIENFFQNKNFLDI